MNYCNAQETRFGARILQVQQLGRHHVEDGNVASWLRAKPMPYSKAGIEHINIGERVCADAIAVATCAALDVEVTALSKIFALTGVQQFQQQRKRPSLGAALILYHPVRPRALALQFANPLAAARPEPEPWMHANGAVATSRVEPVCSRNLNHRVQHADDSCRAALPGPMHAYQPPTMRGTMTTSSMVGSNVLIGCFASIPFPEPNAV